MIKTDKNLIELFRPLIISGLVDYGFLDIPVVQAYQPTIEGANTLPTVYFYKERSQRYGTVKYEDKWEETSMVHKESQFMLTTFNVFAMVIQSLASDYTASDLITAVSDIMQSMTTIETLAKSGVAVLKVSDISNPYFGDDRDIYEGLPSFSFTLSYKNDKIKTIPKVTLPVRSIIQGI